MCPAFCVANASDILSGIRLGCLYEEELIMRNAVTVQMQG